MELTILKMIFLITLFYKIKIYIFTKILKALNLNPQQRRAVVDS